MADAVMPVAHEAIAPEEEVYLKHHFATPSQQMDADTLGMWTFLITEVLFFGGMFASYAVYRNLYYGAFASTSKYMNVTLGATNTAVLICSSLTMVMAVRAAQLSKRAELIRYLFLTMIFGAYGDNVSLGFWIASIILLRINIRPSLACFRASFKI